MNTYAVVIWHQTWGTSEARAEDEVWRRLFELHERGSIGWFNVKCAELRQGRLRGLFKVYAVIDAVSLEAIYAALFDEFGSGFVEVGFEVLTRGVTADLSAVA